MVVALDDDVLKLERTQVRFPLELRPGPAFRIDEPSSWPRAEGRMEYVQGRLFFMPPCADVQQDVAVDVVFVLREWSESHPDFVVGGNEAGMILGGDARAADAAVWRRADVEPRTGHFRRVPPVLAVEVAGEEEGEAELRAKAAWYLEHGVFAVWIVLPASRETIVLTAGTDRRFGATSRVPAAPELPGLEPAVSRFFAQLG